VDEENRLIGIISEHDVINFVLSGDAADSRVEEAMTTDVVTFAPDTPCPVIANCFAKERLRRVPIVENGRLVGVVSRRDLLRQMLVLYTEH
jgi:CBS domain-containing protein